MVWEQHWLKDNTFRPELVMPLCIMHAGKSWTQKLTYRKRYFVADEQNNRKKYKSQKVMKFSYACVKGFVHIATRV